MCVSVEVKVSLENRVKVNVSLDLYKTPNHLDQQYKPHYHQKHPHYQKVS